MLAERHPFIFYSMVIATILLALLIAIIPLSPQYQILRPELVCLLVIYWVLNAPQHLGVSFAFMCGMTQDLVEQTVWGGHAFALSIVAYICVKSYQRIKSYSIWHQTLWVSILVGMHQVSVNSVQSLAGYEASMSTLVASVVISTLLWPVLLQALKRFRQHFRLM